MSPAILTAIFALGWVPLGFATYQITKRFSNLEPGHTSILVVAVGYLIFFLVVFQLPL